MPRIINDNLRINFESVDHDEPLIMLHPNDHCIKDWHTLGYMGMG